MEPKTGNQVLVDGWTVTAKRIRNNTDGRSFWYPVIGNYVMKSRACLSREDAIKAAKTAAADSPR